MYPCRGWEKYLPILRDLPIELRHEISISKKNRTLFPEEKAIFRPFWYIPPSAAETVLIQPLNVMTYLSAAKEADPYTLYLFNVLSQDVINPAAHLNKGWETLIRELLKKLGQDYSGRTYIFVGKECHPYAEEVRISPNRIILE